MTGSAAIRILTVDDHPVVQRRETSTPTIGRMRAIIGLKREIIEL